MANSGDNSALNIARSKSSVTIAGSKRSELKLGGTVFHDFLGEGSAGDSSIAVGNSTGNVRPPSEASPSASVSVGASSGVGRGPISTTSDLGSDRPAGCHFEGVPCYGPRSDFMGPEKPNVFAGMKRCNSGSYAATSADRFPAGRLDFLEGSELIKILRNAGGDRPRWPHDDDSSFPLHLLRQTTDSLRAQPSSGFKTDANASKWDCFIPMNVGPTRQYPPRSSQVVPFGQLLQSNKFSDSNAGQLITSLSAADEGSRTGIKGSGILDSLKESGTTDRNFSGILAASGKKSCSVHMTELESSSSPSQHGLTSAGHQMTIFYNGQAHVFDNVHPNKADIIMALAGLNGESWSTTYAPKSTAIARKSTVEICSSGRKSAPGVAGNFAIQPEVHMKSFTQVNTGRGFSTNEKNGVPTGTSHEEITEKEAQKSSHTSDIVADKKT